MIIRDKQDLRKCVKQCVRRSDAIETKICFDPMSFSADRISFAAGHPLTGRSLMQYAALSAMNLPVHDPVKAEIMLHSSNAEEILQTALASMRAKKVYVRIPVQNDGWSCADERMIPVVTVSHDMFTPGRFGIDYQEAARRLINSLEMAGSHDVVLERYEPHAFMYCMLPVCEDTGAVAHLHFEDQEEMAKALEALSLHPDVRTLISADAEIECKLIELAAPMQNVLVRLSSLEHIGQAISILGTRFLPFASQAHTPEEMVGAWSCAKEKIWQALYDAYLLLARTGYEITREQIEEDVERIFVSNAEALYQMNEHE